MARFMTWCCDGCDASADVEDGGKPSGWECVTVTITGFYGAIVNAEANGLRAYELCPTCQPRLAEAACPKSWRRETRDV